MVETNKLEYKREYTDDIKYTVIAFANYEGGKLYIRPRLRSRHFKNDQRNQW